MTLVDLPGKFEDWQTEEEAIHREDVTARAERVFERIGSVLAKVLHDFAPLSQQFWILRLRHNHQAQDAEARVHAAQLDGILNVRA